MRSLGSLLLVFLSFPAFADCTPRTLLRSTGPIYAARIDHGALYYSIFGQRAVQRVDEATGQTSTVFTLDDPFAAWTVENGTVVLPPKPPAGSHLAQVHDGYFYWIDTDNALLRQSVNGSAIETVAVALPVDERFQYTIFDGRLLFVNAGGLYWQTIPGGVPALLLPRADIAGIDEVTADAILVSTKSPFDPNVSAAQILRVPWSGAPVETIYEKREQGYAPSVSLGAIVRGATTYIVETLTEHFFWTTSTLIVLRDGVARERTSAPNAPLAILAADEDDITLGRWIDAGGMREVVRLCANPPRTRAAKH